MNLSQQIAKHLRDVYFGENWTCSNLKKNLTDLTWQEATTKLHSFNTIATLAYHINYFVIAATKVLRESILDAHDKFSFDHPPIESQKDWDSFLNSMWIDAEILATLVDQLPEDKLPEVFVQEKYGTYYRNLSGIIEHAHYHLGQIVLIKKLLRSNTAS